ncbi:MAG: hypothetical protein ACLT38_10205 [Akkermansia sp.]
MERLLESGLVGGNTTVAVEPSGDGVAVVFEMAAQNLLGGVGSAAIPRSTTGTSPRNAG